MVNDVSELINKLISSQNIPSQVQFRPGSGSGSEQDLRKVLKSQCLKSETGNMTETGKETNVFKEITYTRQKICKLFLMNVKASDS